jgi:hypothetical protein
MTTSTSISPNYDSNQASPTVIELPPPPSLEVAQVPEEKEVALATNDEINANTITTISTADTVTANTITETASSVTSSTNIANSKGAQILLNRFKEFKSSTHKNAQDLLKKADVETNATKIWKKVPSFPPIPKTSSTKRQEQSVQPNADLTNTDNSEDANKASGRGDEKNVKTTAGVSSPPPSSTKKLMEKPSSPTLEDNTAKVKQAAQKAATAATVVAESVATGFRGRYNNNSSNNNDSPTTSPSNRKHPSKLSQAESQTSLILKSRAGDHMQQILDSLRPEEFALLLGRGMLGVNLKQCYLKNHGVFIDYLVQGGQAETSNIVRSGDLLVSLADKELRKSTIDQIPTDIAKARRPAILVFSQGTPLTLERINYMDIVVPMMHRARYYLESSTNEPLCESPVPLEPSHGTSPVPSMELRTEFVKEVALRCLDHFRVDDLLPVVDTNVNFRNCLHNAFLTCALDSRRLPFLNRHFSESIYCSELEDDEGLGPNAQFMLFLELISFINLYDVCAPPKVFQMVHKIAHKFFLPFSLPNGRLQPPVFDFHALVPSGSLRHLEFVLSGNNKDGNIPKDVFGDFLTAVTSCLLKPFLSFCISSECAKMRAYLRNTAPLVYLPLQDLFQDVARGQASAKNCFAYLLMHQIGLLEKEATGEQKIGSSSDDSLESKRVFGASNDICCCVFLRKSLLPALLASSKGEEITNTDVVQLCQQLHDIYLVGALELNYAKQSQGTYQQVKDIWESLRTNQEKSESLALALSNSQLFVTACQTLSEELLFHYASVAYTQFREHKIHEWMCQELAKFSSYHKETIPNLPQSSIKRLLRKAELPSGVSSHKPLYHKGGTNNNDSGVIKKERINAEYAVVFGSCIGPDLASQMPIPGMESSGIRRYVSRSLSDKSGDVLLPPTFESYATVPPFSPEPFNNATTSNTQMSVDGWQISLIDFTIPNAETNSDEESNLFGVSLVLNKPISETGELECDLDSNIPTQFVCQEPLKESTEEGEKTFVSPISVEDNERKVQVSTKLPILNQKLKGIHSSKNWVNQVQRDEYFSKNENSITIGLALVSHQNVILAMRDTLSRLLWDYSSSSSSGNKQQVSCNVLVPILATFATGQTVEYSSLRSVLEPYLLAASAPWIDRPLGSQQKTFERHALEQLSDCLPPIPLALLFATALLEQKIVLSSSRRSVLHSVAVGLNSLTQPLKWSHLLVPLVPASLASDLIQYPAPFVLGVSSSSSENILGNLPQDVTLVDLDVGRVILAPAFGHDNEMVRKSLDKEATAKALRSQTLYFAQRLGAVFGKALKPKTWNCDSPYLQNEQISLESMDHFLSVAHSFIAELLEGVTSCCYWIEEASTLGCGDTSEPTVLFDEDRFLELKNHRSMKSSSSLALSLQDFDLVLESFLRCQSMSSYITSRPKLEMAYY